MKKFFVGILVFLIQGNSGWAKPGFYIPGDARIPKAVRDRRVSVFKIQVPYGDPEKITVKDSKLYDALITGMKRFPFVSDQISICKEKNLETCYFFSQTAYCTGFLTKGGRNLWTSWHCLKSFIQAKRKEMPKNLSEPDLVKAFSQVPVLIKLTDYTGKEVFKSQRNSVVRIVTLPTADKMFEPDDSLQQTLPDGVQIRFTKSFGLGIPISSKNPEPGTIIYQEGFPSQTKDRMSRYNLPDSDGDQLLVTYGKLISTSENFKILGLTLSSYLMTYLDMFHMYSTADSMPEMSGSPVMNVQGELVGISTGRLGPGKFRRPMSRGLNLNMMRVLLQNYSVDSQIPLVSLDMFKPLLQDLYFTWSH